MPDGLARVTVHAPDRRLDLAVPDRLPVAELLPTLLRLAGPEASAADPTVGWRLRRVDGTPLAAERDLRAQAVADGEVLHLVPAGLEWPEPTWGEPAEAFAAAVRDRGRRWSAAADRTAGRVAAGAVLAGGLAVFVGATAPVPAGPGAGLAAAGLIAARWWVARRDPAAGRLLTVAATAYAAVGAVMATTHLHFGLRLVAGAAAMTVAGLVAGLGPAADRRIAAAVTAGAGLAGTAGAVTVGLGAGPVSGWPLVGGAPPAVLATAVGGILAVAAAAAVPWSAVRLGRLPRPAPTTDAGAVFAAAARADATLTGAIWGWCAAAVAVAVAAAAIGGPAGAALAAVVAAGLSARARRFAAVRHRQPMQLAGVAAAVTAAVGLVSSAPPAPRWSAIVPAVLVAVWAVSGAPGPGRWWWSVTEAAALVAVLPAAVAMTAAA